MGEGMEHNHEWESAAGSTRVKLHRGRFGKPVLVDIPNDLFAKQLCRYLSSVLHGFRGSCQVSIKDQRGQWFPLAEADCVVDAIKQRAKLGTTPEVQLTPDDGSSRKSIGGGYTKSQFPRSLEAASFPP